MVTDHSKTIRRVNQELEYHDNDFMGIFIVAQMVDGETLLISLVSQIRVKSSVSWG
jgi:hypothetical protein